MWNGVEHGNRSKKIYMSFLEWVGLVSIMIGLFIGLIYAFNFADSKKKAIENSYNNDIDIDDDDIY